MDIEDLFSEALTQPAPAAPIQKRSDISALDQARERVRFAEVQITEQANQIVQQAMMAPEVDPSVPLEDMPWLRSTEWMERFDYDETRAARAWRVAASAWHHKLPGFVQVAQAQLASLRRKETESEHGPTLSVQFVRIECPADSFPVIEVDGESV